MAEHLPSKAALEELLAFTANSPEAAGYFSQRFEQILAAQNKEKKFADLVTAIDAFSQNVVQEFTTQAGNPWAGQPMITIEELRAQRAEQLAAVAPEPTADLTATPELGTAPIRTKPEEMPVPSSNN